ncbi:Na+-transporting NADH:ubiquinone oxidoreductase subunit C [Fluviicoccus keumensis]|uniref:Na(+)-translocating NADH-quinone reductase subunit C n=1 Tax=Fluviicoccus keumensis TaxID=1435465 RepID=A0A4Q7ZAE1_9GAMM|nr:Na(+)-translocating NADH-quinone reductase subunit C [Fluviicoccus keumensis]RZU47084.1 Na+-transporting NADH:ubiquinone oxidoreductase subunit C [Fluviicoccus keumensis]
MSKESTGKTLLVATVLSVVCSIALAAAVTLLKPIQDTNKSLEKQRKILAAARVLPEGEGSPAEVHRQFQRFQRYLVKLDTGEYRQIKAEDNYDQRKATKDPKRSVALTQADDIAGLKRRANEADIYVLRDAASKAESLVLPISGYGLWSTLYGYIVLQGDANSVVGITFTEHGETPGLGGEVDNPKWKALWTGKQVYDAQGAPVLGLIKGSVDPAKPDAVHQVDGLSGATLTSNGVTHLVRFWMGDLGFRKFLNKVRQEGI